MQEQLKPLTFQLARVKDLSVPEFGTLQAWEASINAAKRGGNNSSLATDASKSSQPHGYSGSPMPYIGETKVFLFHRYNFFFQGPVTDVPLDNIYYISHRIIAYIISKNIER